MKCNSMADKLTIQQRHKCMKAVKGKNTKPEMLVRKYLFSKGFRYRLYVKNLPGKPDIVLRKYKTVIFINGCFWHGHEGCKYATIPQTNTDFWKEKIEGNKRRDKEERIRLRDLGWHVIQIWTCQLKPNNINQTLKNIETVIYSIVLEKYKKN